ncbi:hypothetical protein MMC07_008416 [Pseudocyphellaria aurata]|nr:hypothetical protein [Pseudocyphellaria aurata]
MKQAGMPATVAVNQPSGRMQNALYNSPYNNQLYDQSSYNQPSPNSSYRNPLYNQARDRSSYNSHPCNPPYNPPYTDSASTALSGGTADVDTYPCGQRRKDLRPGAPPVVRPTALPVASASDPIDTAASSGGAVDTDILPQRTDNLFAPGTPRRQVGESLGSKVLPGVLPVTLPVAPPVVSALGCAADAVAAKSSGRSRRLMWKSLAVEDIMEDAGTMMSGGWLGNANVALISRDSGLVAKDAVDAKDSEDTSDAVGMISSDATFDTVDDDSSTADSDVESMISFYGDTADLSDTVDAESVTSSEETVDMVGAADASDIMEKTVLLENRSNATGTASFESAVSTAGDDAGAADTIEAILFDDPIHNVSCQIAAGTKGATSESTDVTTPSHNLFAPGTPHCQLVDAIDKISSESTADPADETSLGGTAEEILPLKKRADGDVTPPQPANIADAMGGGIDVTTPFHDMFAPGTPRCQFDLGGGGTTRCERGPVVNESAAETAGGDTESTAKTIDTEDGSFDPGGADRRACVPGSGDDRRVLGTCGLGGQGGRRVAAEGAESAGRMLDPGGTRWRECDPMFEDDKRAADKFFAPGTPRCQFDPGGGRTDQRDLGVKWTAGEVAGQTFDPGGTGRREREPRFEEDKRATDKLLAPGTPRRQFEPVGRGTNQCEGRPGMDDDERMLTTSGSEKRIAGVVAIKTLDLGATERRGCEPESDDGRRGPGTSGLVKRKWSADEVINKPFDPGGMARRDSRPGSDNEESVPGGLPTSLTLDRPEGLP